MGEQISKLVPLSAEPRPHSLTVPRRFVTVVYEIVNDAEWRGGGNPLHYAHHGLQSVCVSAGDLAALNEDIEAVVQKGGTFNSEQYDKLYSKHVLGCFPNR